MKLSIQICFILSLLLTCSLIAGVNDSSAVNEETGPRLVFQEESFDFGTIEPGWIVDHVFQFRNVGLDTVYIKDVVSG